MGVKPSVLGVLLLGATLFLAGCSHWAHHGEHGAYDRGRCSGYWSAYASYPEKMDMQL